MAYGSDVFTGGTPSANGNEADLPPSYAFDDNEDTRWVSGSYASQPWIVKYDLGVGVTKVIQKYRVMSPSVDLQRAPTAWLFQGSNNDSDWDTLDSQSGITWTSLKEWQDFIFSNSTGYRYYRIYITARNGDSEYTSIGEMEGMESLGGARRVFVVS